MKTTTKLLSLLVLVSLAACGDNKDRPDARQPPDGPGADAQCSNCPAAPALGVRRRDPQVGSGVGPRTRRLIR